MIGLRNAWMTASYILHTTLVLSQCAAGRVTSWAECAGLCRAVPHQSSSPVTRHHTPSHNPGVASHQTSSALKTCTLSPVLKPSSPTPSNTILHQDTPGYNWGEHYQRHLSHNLDAWILFEKPTWSEEFDNSVLHNLILKDLCKRHTAHSIQIYLKTRNLYILVSLDVTIWVEMKWSMTLYVAFHSLYKERDSKC